MYFSKCQLIVLIWVVSHIWLAKIQYHASKYMEPLTVLEQSPPNFHMEHLQAQRDQRQRTRGMLNSFTGPRPFAFPLIKAETWKTNGNDEGCLNTEAEQRRKNRGKDGTGKREECFQNKLYQHTLSISLRLCTSQCTTVSCWTGWKDIKEEGEKETDKNKTKGVNKIYQKNLR